MANFIGDKLVGCFGEEIARELSEKFPNATIPGKKYWVQRRKVQFMDDHAKHLYDHETPHMLARRYNISLRTYYVWNKEAIRQCRKK
jgi:hypothetical protein